MKFRFLGAFALGACLSLSAAAQTPTPPQPSSQPPAAPQPPAPPAAPVKANPADVASLDAILAALYGVISGPAGQKRDWDRMRSLFVPGARLIPSVKLPDGPLVTRVLDVEGYIERSRKTLEEQGFFEQEISRRTETFGAVTHVFSTYEGRRKAEDKPFVRGINSIQLFNDGTRWWIVTVYWDSERPGQTIPEKYLPSGEKK